jgi:hypothetical protein
MGQCGVVYLIIPRSIKLVNRISFDKIRGETQKNRDGSIS